MGLTPITRELHCFHCEGLTDHKVYQIRNYLKHHQFVGGEVDKGPYVTYDQYCCTCQTHRREDVPLDQWKELVKHRTWEA